jgi:hypothetical protein
VPPTTTATDRLPEDVAVGPMPAVAFLGEDLVVAEQYSADGTRVVRITPDGRVTELPEATGLVARSLVSDGSSVVLVGSFCRGEDCSGSLGAFRLRDDRSGWDRIDAPDIDVVEAGIEDRGGAPGRPLLWSSGGWLSVQDGRVVPIDATALARSWSTCATTPTDGTPVAYAMWAPVPLAGGPLAADQPWRRIDAAGAPVDNEQVASVVCTRDSVLVLGHLVEHRFDGRVWTTGPGPDLGEPLADRLLSWGSAPDGTLYATEVERGRVLTRAAGGGWSDTGHTADHVAVSPEGRLWLLPAMGGTIEVVEPS